MEDTRLSKCVMFVELMGGQEKEWMRCLLDDLGIFGIKVDQWTKCSPGRGGMARDGGTRGGTFHGKMGRCREKPGLDYDMRWLLLFVLVSHIQRIGC